MTGRPSVARAVREELALYLAEQPRARSHQNSSVA
jgi:hypothetical protein